jgi:hypothetical protein
LKSEIAFQSEKGKSTAFAKIPSAKAAAAMENANETVTRT